MGNLYGYFRGGFAGDVWDTESISPTILSNGGATHSQ